MFLTRNCATHFAHGPTRPPAAWVHSKAAGTALPWAQGAASHPKQTSPKGRLWLGRCHQCPLCPARAVLACWPLTAGVSAGVSSVPSWSRQPAAHGQTAAQKWHIWTGRVSCSWGWTHAQPGLSQLTPACRRGPWEGLRGRRAKVTGVAPQS